MATEWQQLLAGLWKQWIVCRGCSGQQFYEILNFKDIVMTDKKTHSMYAK